MVCHHVQDTEDYSTGRPYSFNAGGKGVDLLRIRMFSEIYGFKLTFTSKRCPRLVDAAERQDACPCLAKPRPNAARVRRLGVCGHFSCQGVGPNRGSFGGYRGEILCWPASIS